MNKKPSEYATLSKEIQIAFTSFSVFDLVHIVCAAILMVLAYATNPIDQMEAAECGVELVFAVLLISYTIGMVRRHKEVMVVRRFFSFAWLIVACACFCPLTFHLPEIIEGSRGAGIEQTVFMNLTISGMVAGLLAVVCFIITLMVEEKPNRWRVLMLIGIILVAIMAILCLVSTFFEGYTAFALIVRVVKYLAPAPPCIAGIFRLTKPSETTELF